MLVPAAGWAWALRKTRGERKEMLKALVGVVFAVVALAQTADVEKAMRDSEAAWNRGDLETFASYYDDSPQTTFIGREVTRGGTKAILDRYRRGYPTREAMGTLTFSELEVRPLADGVALMTGQVRVEADGRRAAAIRPAGLR